MKFIIYIFLLLTFSVVKSQNITIPDANFKAYLVGNNLINTDNNFEISKAEAVAFTGTINCSEKSIEDLTGIEYFVNIKGLKCDLNDLTSLDLSNNLKIERLFCDYNDLVSLNLGANTNLIYLNCSGNELSTLNLLTTPNLKYLECMSNNLDNLNLSNNSELESLKCNRNRLSVLDLSDNLKIRDVGCENNMIENIDISLNTKLTSLDCRNNKLKTLNINNGGNLFLNLFKSTGNSELTCIQVDNLGNVRYETWDFDAHVNFSTNCQYTAGIDNFIMNDSMIKIYPNPTNELVIVESSKSIEILKVYSVDGTLVKVFHNPIKLEVSNWSKGTYFFHFKIGNKHLTKKIIIK